MLSAKECLRQSPGLYSLWRLKTDISPTGPNVVAGLTLVVCIVIARHTWASGSFENTRFITRKSCNGTCHAWGHTVRSWEERKRKIMLAWCSSFIKVEGGGLGLRRIILYWWILNIKAGIEVWERKSKATEKVSYLGHPGLSKKGTSWMGWPGSLYSCVAGSVFIPDRYH